jgi:hypothetical protein
MSENLKDLNGHLSPHQFDVEISTHDLLKKGVTAARLPGEDITHHRVLISAEYPHAEAQIIAAQMRAITAHAGGRIDPETSVMPTATHARI